ncbi:hypothetical protein D3C71_2045660 [compost metagenome]
MKVEDMPASAMPGVVKSIAFVLLHQRVVRRAPVARQVPRRPSLVVPPVFLAALLLHKDNVFSPVETYDVAVARPLVPAEGLYPVLKVVGVTRLRV